MENQTKIEDFKTIRESINKLIECYRHGTEKCLKAVDLVDDIQEIRNTIEGKCPFAERCLSIDVNGVFINRDLDKDVQKVLGEAAIAVLKHELLYEFKANISHNAEVYSKKIDSIVELLNDF